MKEKNFLKYTLLFILISILATSFYLLWDIVIIFIFVLFFYFLFNPIIKFFEKNNINKSVASLLCVAGVFAIIIFALFAILPKILSQVEKIFSSIGSIKLNEQVAILEIKLKKYFPFLKEKTITSQIESFFLDISNNMLFEIKFFLANFFTIAFTIILLPFILFFFIRDNKKIFNGILNIVPNKYFEATYYVLHQISLSLGNFVRGWILDAFFVGLLCGLGLSIIGLSNSFALGIISGLGHLIPYFGPIIGAMPSILISLSETGNFSQVPFIILVFFVVYTIDNGFFQPYIYYKNIKISPITIIFLIIVGGKLFGIYGMFLAVPLTTAVKTASKHIYIAFKSFSMLKT